MTRALGVAAMAAARTKGTYLAPRHRRIAARRVPRKAVYSDPGADCYTRLNPSKAKNRAIGYSVTLSPRPLSTPRQQ